MCAWREGLPVFHSRTLTLREVEASDAPYLTQSLSAEEVVRFISRPPDTVAAFERWIGRARTQRGEGTFVCFAIVPRGQEHAAGLIQLWRLDKAAHPRKPRACEVGSRVHGGRHADARPRRQT
jgi:RimJ/RimL family protein N-acetyltransferase